MYLGLSVLMFTECDSVEILIMCLIIFSLLRIISVHLHKFYGNKSALYSCFLGTDIPLLISTAIQPIT